MKFSVRPGLTPTASKDLLLKAGIFTAVVFVHGLILIEMMQPTFLLPETKARQQTLKKVLASQVFLVQKNTQSLLLPQSDQLEPEPALKVSPKKRVHPKIVSKTTPVQRPKPQVIKKPIKPVKNNVFLPESTSATTAEIIQTETLSAKNDIVTLPSTTAMAGKNQPPKYPKLSKRLREQGVVQLQLTVKVNGTIADISIFKSSGFKRLDNAALSAVQSWRYQPATRNGKPVEYVYLQPIKFALQ